MIYLFSVTLFLSAALLFWIQPMFGKMILPLLGSTPSVWNTCMVFYQAGLLLGYVYAHASITYLGIRKQAIVHMGILLIPLFFLPITVHGWVPPDKMNPVPWIFALMTISIGAPFFILSASAPMLQKWFSATKHKSADDPYFLYAASNLGSMLVLIGYPFFIEPRLRLMEQSRFWQYTYFVYFALIVACAAVLFKQTAKTKEEAITEVQSTDDSPKLTNEQRKKWVLLSLVPSALMLSVTSFISTDVSPVPLIWIVPLAIYLLTFIIVFSKNPFFKHEQMVQIMPYILLGSFVYIACKGYPIWVVFSLHLISFFVCTMVCHGELARTRPSTKYLTEFYLWISIGGCLGGIFNTLIAPLVFKEIIEYPLALILACFLKPALEPSKKEEGNDIKDDIIWAVVIGISIFIIKHLIGEIRTTNPNFLSNPYWLANAIVYGIPSLFIARKFASNPRRFALSVAAVILVYSYQINQGQKTILRERNFFGIHRIGLDHQEKVISLYHNTTLHGSQTIADKNKCIPTTYYNPDGPIGQMFNAFKDDKGKTNIAALGVGTGSVSCFGREDQQYVFYEIDPYIVDLNKSGKYFTYLLNSPPKIKFVYGDGRLKLKKAPKHYFDFIILDAFSSDAIPVHLITKEAMKLYLSKLDSDGIIVFHVSNRYLDLKPVIGNLAEDLHLVGIFEDDNGDQSRMASRYVLVARKREDFGSLLNDTRWQQLQGKLSLKVWTDDYSNIFSIFNWGKL